MKQLLGGLNLNKDAKNEILSILRRLDNNITTVFKQNDYLKTRYYRDYKRVKKSGNLLEYTHICSGVLRSISRDSLVRTRIYSDLLTLTDRIEKTTGNPRFRVLNDELRTISQKGRKMEPNRVLFKILASEFVSGESGVAELVIQNRNLIPVEVEVIEISSENATISVSGTRSLKIATNEKKSLRLLIIPENSGTLLLKIVTNLKTEGSTVKREEFFQLGVKEPAGGEIVTTRPANAPADLDIVSSTPETPAPAPQEIPPQSSTSTGSGLNIEQLVRKGKADEWAEAITDLVDDEASIDLSTMSSDLYEKKGYRNLLASMFLIDTEEYSQKEINAAIRGDSFTNRGIELLLRLRKEGRIDLSPTTSDQNYLREALNIMTGNYDLKPMEKKRIKEWRIKAGDKHLTINKEVIKDESGRAKSFVFTLKE